MKHQGITAAGFGAPHAAADLVTWPQLNARIADHEAAISRTLDEMATRRVEDAAFNERWNAMSYREAVGFMRGREAVDA